MKKERVVKKPKMMRFNCINMKDPELYRKPAEGHGFIYRYTFKDGRSYIGQTIKTIMQRIKSHRKPSMCVDRLILSGAKFSAEILSEPELRYINQAEDYCILHFGTLEPDGLNQMIGNQNCPMRDERIAKDVSDKFKRYIDSHPEERQRRSDFMSYRHRTGKIKVPEIFFPKKIMCLETGEVFDSIIDAAKSIDLKPVNVSAASRHLGSRKTAGGYHWIQFYSHYTEMRTEILSALTSYDNECTEIKKERLRRTGMNKEITYGGVRYRSVSEASRILGMSRRDIKRKGTSC